MTKDQQTNSNTVSGKYSEQDQQTDLNTVSGKYSEQDQQTDFSSSDEDTLLHSAVLGNYVKEISKNFKLLESEYIKLKKQKTGISLGNMAGGALGGIAGTAIYHAISANWSTIVPYLASAAEAIVAALPVIGIVVGSLAAFGVALFCVYEIYKHREKIKEGAADIGKKMIEGAKTLGNEVKKGYKHSTDSLKRGASITLDQSGNFLKGAAHSGKYSIESDFVQGMLEGQGIKDVVNDTIKAVKANDSCVFKTIQDKIKSLIDLKAEELKSKNVADTTDQNHNLEVESKLRKQSRVVNRLGTILTQNMPDLKNLELVTKIFSEHKGEIEGILKDYKENPKNYPKPPTLSRKVSESMSSSLSSLRRKSSNASEAGSSRANSTASSQAELLDSGKNKKVESTLFSLLKAKVSSLRRSNSASYNVTEYEQLSNASTPKKLSRSNSTVTTSSFDNFEDSRTGSPSTENDGYSTIEKTKNSSTPSTPVKARSPVASSVAPPIPARASSPSGSLGSTQTQAHTQPLANGLDT